MEQAHHTGVHLVDGIHATRLLDVLVGEVAALVEKFGVKGLVVHVVSEEEFGLDLVRLAGSEGTEANRGAPAPIANGSALTCVDNVTDGRDV